MEDAGLVRGVEGEVEGDAEGAEVAEAGYKGGPREEAGGGSFEKVTDGLDEGERIGRGGRGGGGGCGELYERGEFGEAGEVKVEGGGAVVNGGLSGSEGGLAM